MNDETRDLILSVFEASLEAQLRAVRRLRQGETAPIEPRSRKGLSQVDMAFDILKKARTPCMSPTFLIASALRSTLPSIAKASFLPSPKKSPAMTASSVLKKIRSLSSRRLNERARSLPGHC